MPASPSEGPILLASFLSSKKLGVSACREAPLDPASFYPSAPEHLHSSRINAALDLIADTPAGLQSLQALAPPRSVLIEFALNLKVRAQCRTEDGDSIIQLSPHYDISTISEALVHEIKHCHHALRIEALEKRNISCADFGLISLIDEAAAWAAHTIHDRKLAKRGIPGPWASQCLLNSDLTRILLAMERRGHATHDDMMRTLTLAWLIRSPIRHLNSYEPQYLRMAAVSDLAVTNPKLTNAEFASVVSDATDKSFLHGVNFRQLGILGIWGQIDTRRDIWEMARSASDRGRFLDGVKYLKYNITLLEDVLSGTQKWHHMPAGLDARAALDKLEAGEFRERFATISELAQLPSVSAKGVVNHLIERCQRLAAMKVPGHVEPLTQRQRGELSLREITPFIYGLRTFSRFHGTGSTPPAPPQG